MDSRLKMAGAFFIGLYGLWLVLVEMDRRYLLRDLLVGDARQLNFLKFVNGELQLLQEQLEAGLFPDPKQWEQAGNWAEPWGPVMRIHVLEMRNRGLSVVPTIKRIRRLVTEYAVAQWDAKARASQSLGQAVFCAGIIPICSVVLYQLLPGLKEHFWTWIFLTLTCCSWSAVGALWIVKMADRARWAGLASHLRGALLEVQVAIEGFMAQVKSGMPADVAWAKAVQGLSARYSILDPSWNANLYVKNLSQVVLPSAVGRMQYLGMGIKTAIQLSLMEGRPCTERVEGLADAFRMEWKGTVDRALADLPNHALKPLFLCVAPAALLLLGSALFFSVQGF